MQTRLSHNCVVAQNGQADDVKDMAVVPGTGIDLEFDSDGKQLLLFYFNCFDTVVIRRVIEPVKHHALAVLQSPLGHN